MLHDISDVFVLALGEQKEQFFFWAGASGKAGQVYIKAYILLQELSHGLNQLLNKVNFVW